MNLFLAVLFELVGVATELRRIFFPNPGGEKRNITLMFSLHVFLRSTSPPLAVLPSQIKFSLLLHNFP